MADASSRRPPAVNTLLCPHQHRRRHRRNTAASLSSDSSNAEFVGCVLWHVFLPRATVSRSSDENGFAVLYMF